MIFDEAQRSFTAHVLAEYPKEAVGLVVQGVYLPCTNVAEDPISTFKVDPVDLAFAGDVQAVLHSHTYGHTGHSYPKGSKPEWPSTTDMHVWMQDTIPWGIVATDGYGLSPMVWMDDSVIPPLLERTYIHGVQDCYSIVRDYFRLKGINVNNYARGFDWWNTGANLYADQFADAGFKEIRSEDAAIGDVVLMQIRSAVINHSAVITGNNIITHHAFHRLSEEDRLDKWRKSISKYLRYMGPNEC